MLLSSRFHNCRQVWYTKCLANSFRKKSLKFAKIHKSTLLITGSGSRKLTWFHTAPSGCRIPPKTPYVDTFTCVLNITKSLLYSSTFYVHRHRFYNLARLIYVLINLPKAPQKKQQHSELFAIPHSQSKPVERAPCIQSIQSNTKLQFLYVTQPVADKKRYFKALKKYRRQSLKSYLAGSNCAIINPIA